MLFEGRATVGNKLGHFVDPFVAEPGFDGLPIGGGAVLADLPFAFDGGDGDLDADDGLELSGDE